MNREYIESRISLIAHDLNPLHLPQLAVAVGRDAFARLIPRARSAYAHTKARRDTAEVLDAVMEWLARAQDSTGTGGVAIYYTLIGGFSRPYPETTGYIVPTFIHYGQVSGREEYIERARRATRWLVGMQRSHGAFPAGLGRTSDSDTVFNSGQILFGLLAAAAIDDSAELWKRAEAAAQWLTSVQDGDGAWRRYTYERRPHVYYTMVAWALAEAAVALKRDDFADAAIRNAEWALRQQAPDQTFGEFNLEWRPTYLHFIAYTLQGLIEVGRLLQHQPSIDRACAAGDKLFTAFEANKSLAGAYEKGWVPSLSSMCLTGNAQMALVWHRMCELTGDLRYLNAVLKMNEVLKSLVFLSGPSGLRGGVKGSHPVWGRYLSMRYPNWAAKFTADTFLFELQAIRRMLDA